MKSRIVFVLIFLTLSATGQVQAKFTKGIKKSVRMIVFNQTNKSAVLEMLIDGKSVYSDTASVAERRPAIVEERSFLFKPGKHTLTVRDATHNFIEERKFELKEVLNILIFINTNQLGVEMNEQDKLSFQ